MKPVRYGIIGFGGIAENRIALEGFSLDASRFEKNSKAELVAACDRNIERQDAARKLGLKWYEVAEKLLEDKSLDAVIIASNNRTHAALGKKALLAGKHVFLEKPAGVTLEEVSELMNIGKQMNLSIGVDHMMTKNAYNILARKLLTHKTVGDIEGIVLHMEFPFGFTPDEAASWRCADRGELGGPIGDVGSHCFYMAEFLLDDTIEAVQCIYTPKTMNTAVEAGAVIHGLTSRGLPCTIRVAFDQRRGGLHETIGNLGYEVYGSEGGLKSEGALFQFSGHKDEPISIKLKTESRGVETLHTVSDIRNIYQSQINEHAESIRSGALLTGGDGLHNLELILLSHASAAEGGAKKKISQRRKSESYE